MYLVNNLSSALLVCLNASAWGLWVLFEDLEVKVRHQPKNSNIKIPVPGTPLRDKSAFVKCPGSMKRQTGFFLKAKQYRFYWLPTEEKLQ